MTATGYDTYWNVKDLLGDLLGGTVETEPTPRADIWASDLGKPLIDRWLRMKGVPYSNPSTGKDLIRFFLGKQIEEGLAKMLTRSGVTLRSKEKVTVNEPGCLPVVGWPDLVVAVPDWDETLSAAGDHLSGGRFDRSDQSKVQETSEALSRWQARAPEGLPTMVCEIKSLNSAAFKYHRGQDGLSNAYPHHRLQLYTYMRGLGLSEGHLLYVARDTGWIEEVIVREQDALVEAWLQDVEAMSHYFLADERPPLEPMEIDGKENWRIKYSRYKDYLVQTEEVSSGAFAF
jgi:hypothetical protein